MAKLLEREIKLARELKSTCDDKGKELDPTNSAKTIYQLGLVYRDRAPDKFSLIKCAGLLNAAIARKPFNAKQIKNDLSKVCKQILKHAKAKNQNANLLKKSDLVKRKFSDLRSNVKTKMKTFNRELQESGSGIDDQKKIEEKRISGMQDIQQKIADEYLRIMSGLCKYCEGVMGKPPCSYAVAGMGSLARKEITPYSDFEHVILLEEQDNFESNLEYFQWYSVIFHVILLNLQETIIPSLNISSLNGVDSELGSWFYDAHTLRGVSFDGMMPHACKFPLGRQEPTKDKPWITELIKPVSEMLTHLSSEQDLRNGYHLSDILTKTCFVYGEETVYDLFASVIHQFVTKCTPDEIIETIKQQVKEDLNKFSTRFRLVNLKIYGTEFLNIKEVIYRSSTLFIAAFGRISHILSNSCFDIIRKLAEKSIITENTKHKLLYALAIACQIRLTVYMREKCQRDHVDFRRYFELIGPFVVLSYFQIAYCLQCEIARCLKFTRLHFYSKPHMINVTFLYAFKMNHIVVPLLGKIFTEDAWKISSFEFDSCLNVLEMQLCELNIYAQPGPLAKVAEILLLDVIATQQYESNLFDEALEFFLFELQLCDSDQLRRSAAEDGRILTDCLKTIIADVHRYIGCCYDELNRPNEALNHFLHYLNFVLEKSLWGDEFRCRVAYSYQKIGICFLKLFRTDHSFKYLKKSLEGFLTLQTNTNKYVTDIAFLHKLIGMCLMQMWRYHAALDHINKSLELYRNTSILTEEESFDIITGLTILKGQILMMLNRFNDAQNYLKKSLSYFKNSFQANSESRKAFISQQVRSCLLSFCKYAPGLDYLSKSLTVYENLSIAPDYDLNIAYILYLLGSVLFFSSTTDDQTIQAKEYLMKALAIYQNNALMGESKMIFYIKIIIGQCLMRLQRYDDALHCLKRSLENIKNIPSSLETNLRLATTHNLIGCDFINLHRYSNTLDHFHEALDLAKELNAISNQNTTLAEIHTNIGKCLLHFRRYNDAEKHFQKAHVYQNANINDVGDGYVAELLVQTGCCLFRMGQYENALTEYFEKALNVHRLLSVDDERDMKVARCYCIIGVCSLFLMRYDNAFGYFVTAHAIHRNISPDIHTDIPCAVTFNYLGTCYENMEQYENGLLCYEKSLTIYHNISPNESADKNIASLLKRTGICLTELEQHENAFEQLNRSCLIYQNISLDLERDENIDHIKRLLLLNENLDYLKGESFLSDENVDPKAIELVAPLFAEVDCGVGSDFFDFSDNTDYLTHG